MSEGQTDDDPPERPRRHLRRWILLTVASVVIVAIAVAGLISVPYYAITPGTAQSVGTLISVPKANGHTHTGQVLLTDVELVPLRALDYLFFKLNGDDDVVPTAQLLGPSTTSNQYDEQGTIDMASARQAATVVALRSLGYHVSAVASGVVDYQPEPGSPAASGLAVGDVITGVDGQLTPSFQALADAVSAKDPGSRVTLTTHFLGSTKVQHLTLHLGAVYSGGSLSSGENCLPIGPHGSAKVVQHDGRGEACLGLYLEQLYATKGAPFGVNIDSEGIIGPSAGLAFTLGLIQKLDRSDLTGGKRVAATGTMAINGDVGDVGGVAQKTVAVRDAGAVLFLVPPQELAVAKAHAGSHLKVVAVSTITQALTALQQLGGRVTR